MILVFEGIDGSGKDTQMGLAVDWIKTQTSLTIGEVFVESEPTRDSEAGRELHRLLEQSGESSIDILDQKLILDLYLKDRFIHSHKLRYLTERGLVFLSRYDLSSYAYQSLHLNDKEVKDFFEEIYLKHRYLDANGCLIPDLTLFFILKPKVAISRIEKRGETKIKGYEKLKVLDKVEKSYERAIDYLRKKDGRKIVALNASVSLEEVFHQVRKIIIQKLKSVSMTPNFKRT